jgi:hypothetical protein
MSLFGARKTVTSLRESLAKAKENMQQREASPSPSAVTSESSHIGRQLDIQRALQDSEGTATTSEINMEGREEEGEQQGQALVLPREIFNEAARIHNQEAREEGHPSQIVSTVHGGSSVDDEGHLVYKQPRVYTIPSDTGSPLSSPPTTSYGGSDISFPQRTQSTQYEGSVVAFPPSALPVDPFSTPKASAGIIAKRYIQSEEDASQNAITDEEEGGMGETRKVYTPILRKSEISGSEDDVMTEVEWREEEPYMTPTKKGKTAQSGEGS